MFINLGKIEATYNTKSNNDFFIVSEIVNSRKSFEIPTLVRSIDELNIWFGNDFKDYDYLAELINKGIFLYLYKPISENLPEIEGVLLDFSTYSEDTNTFYINSSIDNLKETVGDIVIKSLPKLGEDNVLYKVLNHEGTGSLSYKNLEYDNYIWYNNRYLDIKDISIGNNSSSLNNRDCLYIHDKGIYTTPKYSIEYNLLDYTEFYYIYTNGYLEITSPKDTVNYTSKRIEDLVDVSFKEGDIIKLNYPILNLTKNDIKEKLDSELYTLSWYIDWETIKEDTYIAFLDKLDKFHIFYYKSISPELNNIINNISCSTSKFNTVEELQGLIKGLGYSIVRNYVISNRLTKITFFGSNVTINPDFILSHSIINSYYKDSIGIKFWSKIIGESQDLEKISVKIDYISDTEVSILLSCLGYQEYYEGSLIGDIKKERIDYTINKRSKLVGCNIINSKFIEKGNWILNGSYSDTIPIANYKNSLLSICNTDIPFDFLLVPDKNKYSDNDLLNIAKKVNCQVLIQNTSDNYFTNLITDKDNRLIYFYSDFKYYNQYRPGYYVYLKGLLHNIYSVESKEVIYNIPNDSLAKDLEKYKSNYLTYSGQYYFYKTYFNGDNPTTSGWMRFVISKISREFEKNKWELIGPRKDEGRIRNRILNLIETVRQSYSIILSITLDKYSIDYPNNRINLTITTTISDLVSKNITLDLTINFKK